MNRMKMSLRVKQQRYTMTGSKIRRGVLQNIQPIILFRERGKNKLTIGIFDDLRLMLVDPPQKLNSEESDIISSCFGTSIENQSNEVMSNTVLTNILNRWDESKTQLHTSSIATTLAEHISPKVF